MAVIEKRGAKSYRIKKMVDRVTYSVTVDFKPTKKQAEQIIQDHIAEKKRMDPRNSEASFSVCAKSRIESVGGVLSPSTLNEYSRLLKYLEDHYSDFAAKPVRSITSDDIQKVISSYSKGRDDVAAVRIDHRSAKSVRNMYGFIRSVMSVYAPSVSINVVLPDIQRKERHIPTDEEAAAVFAAVKGSKYEIPILLAALGMRRSEICGASIEDLDGCTLYIHRSKVMIEGGRWTVKDYGKTPSSTRYIDIPQSLADKIRETGRIFDGDPETISKYLAKIQDQLGIERFTLHALRHFYASSAVTLGVSLKYIQRAGGWKTDSVLKNIYAHAQKDKQKEQDSITMNHMAKLFGD